MTKTNKIVYYLLLALVSVGFLMSGYLKLTTDATQVQTFGMVGLPMWFMYFIGVCEILGIIGLWMPKFQKWAACGLEIIMLGAIVVSIMELGVVGGIIPLVIFIFLCIISRLGKKRGMAVPTI